MDGRLAFMVPIRGRQYLGAAFENVFHEHMSIGVLNWTCHKCAGETISWSWSSIYQMTNFVDGWTVPAQAWVSAEWGLIQGGCIFICTLESHYWKARFEKYDDPEAWWPWTCDPRRMPLKRATCRSKPNISRTSKKSAGNTQIWDQIWNQRKNWYI